MTFGVNVGKNRKNKLLFAHSNHRRKKKGKFTSVPYIPWQNIARRIFQLRSIGIVKQKKSCKINKINQKLTQPRNNLIDKRYFSEN